jgi:hypothetical protein
MSCRLPGSNHITAFHQCRGQVSTREASKKSLVVAAVVWTTWRLWLLSHTQTKSYGQTPWRCAAVDCLYVLSKLSDRHNPHPSCQLRHREVQIYHGPLTLPICPALAGTAAAAPQQSRQPRIVVCHNAFVTVVSVIWRLIQRDCTCVFLWAGPGWWQLCQCPHSSCPPWPQDHSRLKGQPGHEVHREWGNMCN